MFAEKAFHNKKVVLSFVKGTTELKRKKRGLPLAAELALIGLFDAGIIFGSADCGVMGSYALVQESGKQIAEKIQKRIMRFIGGKKHLAARRLRWCYFVYSIEGIGNITRYPETNHRTPKTKMAGNLETIQCVPKKNVL